MRMLLPLFALIWSGCMPTTEADSFLSSTPSELPQPGRLIALGDVHGDFSAAKKALKLAGVLDADGHWSGGATVVVQLGDQLDRGDEERQVIDSFRQLHKEAEEAGGGFYWLIGNHEVMNVQIDFRYVTSNGFKTFDGFSPLAQGDDYLDDLSSMQKGRGAAFRPGGPYAKFLAENNVIMKVGDSVMVHGGLKKAYAEYGLKKMNAEMQRWISGKTEKFPEYANDDEGPLWDRTYGDQPSPTDCAELTSTLEKLGASRLIVAHTVQENGISSACSEKVWRVDTGMAAYYGGPTEVLEILRDGQIKVLKPSS